MNKNLIEREKTFNKREYDKENQKKRAKPAFFFTKRSLISSLFGCNLTQSVPQSPPAMVRHHQLSQNHQPT